MCRHQVVSEKLKTTYCSHMLQSQQCSSLGYPKNRNTIFEGIKMKPFQYNLFAHISQA